MNLIFYTALLVGMSMCAGMVGASMAYNERWLAVFWGGMGCLLGFLAGWAWSTCG